MTAPTTPVPTMEPHAEAEAMLRKHAAMYDWSKAEAKAINDFILTVRFGVQEDLAALTSEVARLTEEEARMDRLEWADARLIVDEEVSDPMRRFTYRDMATPPTADSPDGTIYGPTARAVLDAALAASRAGSHTETET